MKTKLLFLFIFFSCNEIFSQGWILSTVQKGSNIEPKFSTIDNQSNLIVSSTFQDTVYQQNFVSYGSNDIAIFKFDPLGNTVWSHQIGSTGNESLGGIVVDDNNNIYLTGGYSALCKFSPSISTNTKGGFDIFLAKYDASGALIWAKTIGTATNNQVPNNIKYANGKLIISGFFKDSLIIGSEIANYDTLVGNSNFAHFISQFDTAGNRIWAKRFLGNDDATRFSRIGISQNGYYFSGNFKKSVFLDVGTISSQTDANYDAFLYKTDFDGNGQWVRRIRGSGTENFRSLSTDEFDNVYLLGNYNSPTINVDSTQSIVKTYSGNTGGYDTYISKFNRSGILQWFVRKGSSSTDIYLDLVVRNNIIYATGYFSNQIIFNNDTLRTSGSSNGDPFLVAFNETGNAISGINMVGTGNYYDAGVTVNMDNSSRAYVAGYFRSQQFKIGNQPYTSNNVNKSDQFFAIYAHPFKAVITKEKMVTCNGLNDGMLQVTPYFGKPPFTYTWSHNAALHDPVAENLPAGDYTVTITDANSTQASITRTVTQPAPLVITPLVTPVTCYNGGDGAIDITVTGGTKAVDYVYNWTSPTGSGIEPLDQDQTGLTGATYTVIVRDDHNCTASSDIVVSHPQRFSFAGTVVTDIVLPIPPGHNGAVNLNIAGGNAPYTYAWTGPGTYNAASQDIGNLADAGLYNLHLTDTKLCASDTSFAVIDNFTFIAQVTEKTDVLCFGQNNGSATVEVYNGTSPFSYQWSDGVTIGLATRTNMPAGSYTVQVTDGALNSAVASIEILGPSAGLILTMGHQDLLCFNDNTGVVDLTVTNGTLPYQFSWNNGYTGEDLVNVAQGLYTVTVTDANNCSSQNSVNVGQPTAISLDIDIVSEVLCYGGRDASATANASGGVGTFGYLWDDPGSQTTKTATELSAGFYTVVVTDENGCTRESSTEVVQPDSLYMESVILTDPACTGDANGSIAPTINGGTIGYEYAWSNNVFQRFNTDIPEGSYTLTVTDNNNCELTKVFELTDPTAVLINAVDSVPISCYGLADGFVRIDASGGTGVLSYSADNGASYSASLEIGSLDVGDHIILVKDEHDCESTPYPITFTQPDIFLVDTLGVVYIDAKHPTGTISLQSQGGISPISFYIVPDGSSNSTGVFDLLAAGNYRLYAMDAGACESNEMLVSLPEPVTDLTIFDAFSPNGDGKNDVWNIRNIDYYPNCSVKIFNSWGVAVFSSKGYGTPWDGKYNGNDLPSGTYYYVIVPGDGSGTLTGPVSIVK
jgi:gliding motility-associated-like protein